jgi:hypothetical protein
VPLIYAGIDEAGYGPLLGPLCVAMSVFRVADWIDGEPAPDLWKRLKGAVADSPAKAKQRIAIADSKRLKLHSGPRHPLFHLERGVLAGFKASGECPASDGDLFRRCGCAWEAQPWYGGESLNLPLACDGSLLGIDANRLAGSMASAGVELLELRVVVIWEGAFNDIVRRTGSKGETTISAVGEHLRRVAKYAAAEPVRAVCDRLGGRISYSGVLGRELQATQVSILEESARVCRYEAAGMGIQFLPEAESAHLPVALASMLAKYVRELAMERFNRYWCAMMPELKPTAGYNTDARRWLADATAAADVRRELVRIA